MKIGIIGAGYIGSTLAKHFIDLGHDVIISNSRGPQTLGEVVERTGATAGTAEESASASDLVIITVQQSAIPNLPLSTLSSSKAIIVDTGNYYPDRDGRIDDIENGLTDSGWVSKVIGRPVLKAFNNIGAGSLASKGLPQGSPNRIALSVAEDDTNDKETVLKLIDDIGFDAIDAGSLADSWRQQPGEASYCRDLSKENLIKALENADISKRSENLKEANKMVREYFKNLKK